MVVEIEEKIEPVVPSSYRITADVGNDDAYPEENFDEKEMGMKHVVVISPVILDVDEI
jgi:hypothetical protein